MFLEGARQLLDHRAHGDRPENDRATRYEIRVPVMYRSQEGGEWQEGWSRDISPSGMLLHVLERVRIGTKIEMAFTVALNRRTNFATRVMGTGEVVRITTEASELGHVLGIRILDYNLSRMPEQSSEQADSTKS